jgi:hypothetical protein
MEYTPYCRNRIVKPPQLHDPSEDDEDGAKHKLLRSQAAEKKRKKDEEKREADITAVTQTFSDLLKSKDAKPAAAETEREIERCSLVSARGESS